jgi:hypothetical protein
VTYQPVPSEDYCSDCGTALEHGHDEERCPVCFDNYLTSIDVGFLDSYRKFGCRSRLVVAETCLRGLVLATPEHRKVLAMTIFEQYVQSMNDLAGLFIAFRNRDKAPILKSFMEFRLDAQNAAAFFDAVQSVTDVELCASLDLPLPGQVRYLYPHLDEKDSYSVAVAIYQLVQDLRRATDQGNAAAMALAQFAGQAGGAIIADDAKWLNGAGSKLTPDQVAMLVLDSKRRSIYVQGLTADESAMGKVVDAIDTTTRAASNLIFAYLQTNDL